MTKLVLAALVLTASGCSSMPDAGSLEPKPDRVPVAPTGNPGQEGPGPLEVRLLASEMRFEPNVIEAVPEQIVVITVANQGKTDHSIEFVLPSGELRLGAPVASGAEGKLEIKAPLEEGDYLFYCPLKDHKNRGMTGRLSVKGAG